MYYQIQIVQLKVDNGLIVIVWVDWYQESYGYKYRSIEIDLGKKENNIIYLKCMLQFLIFILIVNDEL